MGQIHQLGARHWINNNMKRAELRGISDHDIATEDAVLKRFLLKTGLSREELAVRGAEVQRLGYAEKTGERRLRETGSEIIEGARLLRNVQPKSLAPDGRMPQSDVDNQRRYRLGPPQGHNTCAIDAMTFAAIRLDAGRTQIDQLSLKAFSMLKEIPQMIRRIVGQPWGELSGQERAEQRDFVATALSQYPGFVMTKGDFLTISEVIITCFEGLAQLSYTTVNATICCDGKARVSGTALVERLHYYSIMDMGRGVQGALTEAFTTHPVHDIDIRAFECSRGKNCKHKPDAVKMVLDRLPPVLMITMPDAPKLSTPDLFGNIRIQCREREGWATKEYEVVGCIIHLLRSQHFITRWRAERPGETEGTLIHFDGMSSEEASYVKSWGTTGRHQQRGVEVMFYRRVQA